MAMVFIPSRTNHRSWLTIGTTVLALACQAIFTIPASHALEEKPPEKTVDGLAIIYSPEAPGWLPPPIGTLLPEWVDLSINWVSQPVGNISGGSARKVSYADQTTIDVTLGPGLGKEEAKRNELDRWSIHGNFGLQLGTPAFTDEISTLFSPQSIYNAQGFWLRGLFVERASEKLSIRFGPGLSMGETLDSPAYLYYASATIDNTINLQLPGLPIDPYSSFGGLIEYKFTPNLVLRYGAYQLNEYRGANTTGASDYFGWNIGTTRGDNGVVQSTRLEYAYMPSPDGLRICLDRVEEGIYLREKTGCKKPGAVENNLPPPLVQVGGYVARGTFRYLNDPDRTGKDAMGLYTHLIAPVNLPIGHGSRLWSTLAFGSNQQVNQVPFIVMGGLISQGVIATRPFDQLIVGFSRSSLSNASRYPSYDPLGSRQTYSGLLELGYNFKMNQRFNFEPVLQIIFNPSGTGQFGTVVAPGLQMSLSL